MWTVNQLEDIQHRTQARFTYKRDIERWLTPEYWISSKDGPLLEGKWEGDCDDFALICRAECRALQIPNRLVFCWVPRFDADNPGGYHLVTEVDGRLFDVRYPHLMDRDMTNYTFIEASGYETGDPWHWIKGFDPSKPWPHTLPGA